MGVRGGGEGGGGRGCEESGVKLDKRFFGGENKHRQHRKTVGKHEKQIGCTIDWLTRELCWFLENEVTGAKESQVCFL